MCTYAMRRQLLPTTVLLRSDVPRLTVTNSRMVVSSPISAVVISPANFKSCGMAEITAPGNMRQFLPIRAPSRMVALAMTVVPSPISTSPEIAVNGPTVTFLPILASGCISAFGLIILFLLQFGPSFHLQKRLDHSRMQFLSFEQFHGEWGWLTPVGKQPCHRE